MSARELYTLKGSWEVEQIMGVRFRTKALQLCVRVHAKHFQKSGHNLAFLGPSVPGVSLSASLGLQSLAQCAKDPSCCGQKSQGYFLSKVSKIQ